MTKKLKILLVEDDRDLLSLLVEEFNSSGHDVHFASSGYQAIEILKTEEFDSVVSDYRMPNGNGKTLLNYVNEMQRKPLFFMISADNDLTKSECLELGVRDFFCKPFNIYNLISAVEQAGALS